MPNDVVTREELQDVQAAQAERIARLEALSSVDDKRWATKGDLSALELRLTEKIRETELRLIKRIGEVQKKILDVELRLTKKIRETELRLTEKIGKERLERIN